MSFLSTPPNDAVPLLDSLLSHSTVLTNAAAIVVLGIAIAFLGYLFQPLLKGLARAGWLLLRNRLQRRRDGSATLGTLPSRS